MGFNPAEKDGAWVSEFISSRRTTREFLPTPVPPELRETIVKQSQSLAAEQAVKLTVYQAPENLLEGDAPAAPAIAPTIVASTATAPPIQAAPQPTPVVQPVVQGDVIVEEPVLRPSETPPQPQVKDVSSILSKWGAKS